MTELVTRTDLDVARRELKGTIERQTLRLTIRLGGMVAVAVAILVAIVRLRSGQLSTR